MPRRRNVAPRPARRTRRPSPPTASEAERRLLALARELGGLGRDALPRALRALAAAYAPDAPLSRAVAHAFLATRGDKTGALALAWARPPRRKRAPARERRRHYRRAPRRAAGDRERCSAARRTARRRPRPPPLTRRGPRPPRRSGARRRGPGPPARAPRRAVRPPRRR